MEKNNKSIIESVLYVSGDEGIKVADLKKVLDLATDDIRKLLNEMKKEMDNDPNRGITIECFEDTYHLLTKKENHDELTKLFDIKIKNPLTGSMLETLAIIAYNMPCPTSKVEQIRGHNAINTIQKLLKLESKQIPKDIDYNKITNLASEAKQKLTSVAPVTLAQASRISGVNPADLSILAIYLKKEYSKNE